MFAEGFLAGESNLNWHQPNQIVYKKIFQSFELISMENFNPKDLPTSFYTPKSFFSLNGAAVAVWIFCLVLGAVLPPRALAPIQYRIIAISLSEIIAVIIVFRSKKRKLDYWFLAIFNGILIFVNASGWNVITSNTFFRDKAETFETIRPGATTASLLNFHQINWWADNSLFMKHKKLLTEYDSLRDAYVICQATNKKYFELAQKGSNIGGRSDFIIDSLKREIQKKDNILAKANVNNARMQSQGPIYAFGNYALLDKMNVLYVGVDNPITIFPNNDKGKISISYNLGSVSYSGEAGRYNLRPTKVGLDTLLIKNNEKIIKYPVRIKSLPDPTVFIGNTNGGNISSATFKASGSIQARLPNTEFYAPFQVISYMIGASGGSFNSYIEAPNAGARWSESALTIVNQARAGASIFFTNIRVKGPDGIDREIPPIVFTLY